MRDLLNKQIVFEGDFFEKKIGTVEEIYKVISNNEDDGEYKLSVNFEDSVAPITIYTNQILGVVISLDDFKSKGLLNPQTASEVL